MEKEVMFQFKDTPFWILLKETIFGRGKIINGGASGGAWGQL